MLTLATNPRPNRFTEVKNEDYHIRYARWALGSYNLYSYQDFVTRYLTNRAFYSGNQWIFEEDLDAFLMDESGEARNRIKFIHNIIKPFVEYYRGAAIRMDLSAEVTAISREASNRRTRALDRLMFYTRVANLMQQYGNKQGADMMRQQFGVAESEDETIARFNNLYVDELVEKMTTLLRYVTTVRNDFSSYKAKLAEYFALSGLGVMAEDDFAGEQTWRLVPPERFIVDNTAQDPTLKDAEFMGEYDMMSPTDIYEMHPILTYDQKLAIEKSIVSDSFSGIHNFMSLYFNYAGRSPVYKLYWRDVSSEKWGAFYDEFGYPCLQKVGPDYPLNEAIQVDDLKQMADDNVWIKDILNPKGAIRSNTRTIETETIRYCKFIPAEYSNVGKDIALAYGERPYQSRHSLGIRQPDYPYKCATYSYTFGQIMSPVESLISPQRFLNRVISVAESHINNSRGSGTIIDKDSIDAQEGEEGILRNMNLSKPIMLNSQRNVNNSVMSYDATIKQGTFALFDIADRMKNIANDMFGGGQQILGQGGAYRATGGVAEMNLSQGVIMQEPFFHAIERVYMQAYNSVVTRGKRIYTSNHKQLALTLGDDGVEILELTDDMDIEEFNCKVVRSPDIYTEKEAANQLLMVLMDKGLIDQKTFAEGFNNSSINKVAYLLRQYTGMWSESQRMQAAAQAENEQVEMEQARLAEELVEAKADKKFEQEKQLNDDNNITKLMEAAMQAESKKEASKEKK